MQAGMEVMAIGCLWLHYMHRLVSCCQSHSRVSVAGSLQPAAKRPCTWSQEIRPTTPHISHPLFLCAGQLTSQKAQWHVTCKESRLLRRQHQVQCRTSISCLKYDASSPESTSSDASASGIFFFCPFWLSSDLPSSSSATCSLSPLASLLSSQAVQTRLDLESNREMQVLPESARACRSCSPLAKRGQM